MGAALLPVRNTSLHSARVQAACFRMDAGVNDSFGEMQQDLRQILKLPIYSEDFW